MARGTKWTSTSAHPCRRPQRDVFAAGAVQRLAVFGVVNHREFHVEGSLRRRSNIRVVLTTSPAPNRNLVPNHRDRLLRRCYELHFRQLGEIPENHPGSSETFNQLAIRFLYKYAIFNRPHSFDKFLRNIVNQPDIGQYVEFMDFQTFTSIGLGRTGRMNQEIQMVTARTIQMALSLCPNLIEFQASENIQDDMDVEVLLTLFNHLPKVQALDFCGASLKLFAQAFMELTFNGPDLDEMDMETSLVLKASPLEHLFKISFHDCSNLPVLVFEKCLPHFINLRRLDVTHTTMTSTALHTYLPASCRLTHLSLARCSKLTTKDLIQFLTKHPAIV